MTWSNGRGTFTAWGVSMCVILFLAVFVLLSVLETSVRVAARKQISDAEGTPEGHVVGVDDGLIIAK